MCDMLQTHGNILCAAPELDVNCINTNSNIFLITFILYRFLYISLFRYYSRKSLHQRCTNAATYVARRSARRQILTLHLAFLCTLHVSDPLASILTVSSSTYWAISLAIATLTHKAMLALLSSPSNADRFGANGRARVKAHFSFAAFSDALNGYIASLVR
jgi:hypothetical protein